MNSNKATQSITNIAIDFIDPLFAVVISISFVEVMERPWFAPTSTKVYTPFVFDIGALLLGYSTVVLSWVGYHRSIRNSPIRIETPPGFLRFICDIMLLAWYWLLLVKFENFLFVLLMLVAVYWVFVVWDQFKWWEYKHSDSVDSRRRRGVSTVWAVVFTILFLLYWLMGFGNGSLDKWDWVFLVLAHSATILYRLHKQRLYFGPVLDVLSFHLAKKEASA